MHFKSLKWLRSWPLKAILTSKIAFDSFNGPLDKKLWHKKVTVFVYKRAFSSCVLS